MSLVYGVVMSAGVPPIVICLFSFLFINESPQSGGETIADCVLCQREKESEREREWKRESVRYARK